LSYDVVINYNSTDYSYMLAEQRDSRGMPTGIIKKYKVSDYPLIPEVLVTGTASPSTLSPDREIQIIQNDWRKGFQDVYFDDSRKYQDAVDCDARYKGKVMLAPKQDTAIGFPSYTTSTITDGGLESWTGDTPNSWTETGAGVVGNTAEEHGGSACAAGGGAVGEKAGTIYQDLSWSTAYRGDVFTCQAYFKCSSTEYAATWGKLSITDGVNTVTSDTIRSTSWTPAIVSILICPTATKIRITASYNTDQAFVYIDDITKLAQDTGGCTAMKEYGGYLVIASDKSLYKLSSGALVWLTTFPAEITDLCVFEDRLFIAQGWSANYWYTDDLGAFMYCTLTNSTAKYMATVGGDQFWIASDADTVRDSDNPISGGTAFSTAYTVGSADYDITGLVDNPEGTVYVRKENMVYYLDSEGVDYELIPELATESTAYDYRIYMWKGCLYIPSGVNSLYEYDNGTVTTISPVKYTPGDSVYAQNVLAICGDETYLYVALNGSLSCVIAGRWENVAGDTDWYWHPLYIVSTDTFSAMQVSSSDINKKLYAGADVATNGIYPFWVSPSYSDPTGETNFAVQSSGNFDTPFYTSAFSNDNKYWSTVDLGYTAPTGTGIQVYKSTDGSNFTSIGNVNNNSSYNIDTFTVNATAKKIMFRFNLTATNTSLTPTIYGLGGMGYGIKGRVYGSHQRRIDAVLRIAAGVRQRSSTTKTTKTVSTELTNLRTLYQANAKMTITGPDSTAYTVIFAREGYEEQMVFDETGKLEEWEVSVGFLEVI